MKVLLIGSGGREDAFAWKLNKEKDVDKIFAMPGNPAMLRHEKVELLPNMGTEGLLKFALDQVIDITIVGPEAPLTEGIQDLFKEQNLTLFGPSLEAARLEGSKIFSKEFMKRMNIPTADFSTHDSFESASMALKLWPIEEKGIVIKADGLAGGKGVVVTHSRIEAETTLHQFMIDKNISVKSDKILFEDILMGEEVSAFAFCHEEEFIFLGMACDHKRVFDHDKGPNTGGMGCYHDPQWPKEETKKLIIEKVLKPTLKGMKEEGRAFSGILFMGLMIDSSGYPSVIEYNVRFGDPETQTLMPLLKGDLAITLKKLLNGESVADHLSINPKYSVHIVATSGGYPSLDNTPMSLGHVIHSTTIDCDSHTLFYAGINEEIPGQFVNSGGRVLGVTAVGESLESSRELAYREMKKIQFSQMHYRTDIGLKRRDN